MKIREEEIVIERQSKTIKLLQDKIRLLEFDVLSEKKEKAKYKNMLFNKSKTLEATKMQLELFKEDKNIKRIDKLLSSLKKF